ncbi:solute carrier family 66 member 3 [Biomphalaria pfeifferi]|uniref:Solute carrier family 66 member 3 n=1 Tax=Biomphalaria pfeifferi TaxID=112525 RepID=A0AAD8BSY1_BIOPF|nr:solute carrier family 66 member 3 [Biomphalaria pfeifferi]
MFLGYNGTTYELLVSFCNFLSYTVVGVTCIYKAPQVYAVVSSGSSLGIAIPSLTLEFTSYTIETGYQYGMGYPLDTYFETTLMWAQDVILFWVVLENRKMVNLRLTPYIALYPFTITRNSGGKVKISLMYIPLSA